MAEETVRIIISESGADAASRKIAGIGVSAKSSEGAVSLLNRALGAVASLATINYLKQLSDSYTNIQNRLRLVTNTQQELIAVENALATASIQTRTAFEDNANFYYRLAASTKNLNLSHQELIGLLKTIDQAVIISGANSAEAANGLTQFSQGLAAGALQGQDLRSVVSFLPRLANAIGQNFEVAGKKIGVSGEALRAWANQAKNIGILKTAGVIKAIQEEAAKLDTEFKTITPTISQSFTNLHTSLIRFVGGISQSVGAARFFQSVIQGLIDNLDTLAVALTVIAGIAAFNFLIATVLQFGTILASVLLTAGTGFVRLYSIVRFLAIGPFKLLALAMEGIVILAKLIEIALFSALGPSFVALLVVAAGALYIFQEDIGKAILEFNGFGQVIGFIVGEFIGGFNIISSGMAALVVTVIHQWDNAGAAFKSIGITLANELMAGLTEVLNRGLQSINDLLATVNQTFGTSFKGGLKFDFTPFKDEGEKVGFAFADEFRKNFDEAMAVSVPESAKRIYDTLKQYFAQFKIAVPNLDLSTLFPKGAASGAAVDGGKKGKNTFTFAKALADLQELNSAMRDSSGLLIINSEQLDIQNKLYEIRKRVTKDFSIEETAADKALERQILLQLQKNELDKREVQIAQQLNSAQHDLANGTEALNAALADHLITLDQYNTKLTELKIAALDANHDMLSGFKSGLLTLSQDAQNVASTAKQTMLDIGRGIEDFFVQVAQTGKFNFNSLLNTIFAGLTKLAVQESLIKPLGNLFSGSGGTDIFGGFLGSLLSPNGVAGFGSPGIFGNSLPGFATGADFMIPGSGSSDSQLVQFMGTPGERVRVTPRGEGGEGGGRTVIIKQYFYVSTPDANSFKNSQGQILAKGKAGIDRAGARNN